MLNENKGTMKIDEIRTLEGVSASEIKEGCWKVAASEGMRLRVGEVYTEELFMGTEADIDFGIVTEAEAKEAEAEIEAKRKAEMEAARQEGSSEGDHSSPDYGTQTADEDGEGGTALTTAQRVTALEGRMGAVEADVAALQAQVSGGGEGSDGGIMAIGDDL